VAARGAARKSSLPALRHLLLAAEDGAVTATGPDLSLWVTGRLPLAAEAEGACCVDAATLTELLGALPAGEATLALGAEVVLSHHGDAPREVVAAGMARDLAAERGLVLLHPFDDMAVIAGQGTAAVEALAQMGEAGAVPEVVVCPVGGGGLIGGVSLMMRGAQPGVAIWGCEPEGHDGMGLSLRAGARVAAPGGPTLCDALQAPMPGVANFAACQAAGVTGLAVADAPVAQAMARAFEVLKLVLEPSGAVALAAVLAGQVPVAGKVVLVVASGGNVAFDRFSECLAMAGRTN